MRGSAATAEVLEAAACCKASADPGASSQLIDEEGISFRKLEGDREVIDFLHNAWLFVDLHFREWCGHDLWIRIDILEPEHEIIRGQWLAIRPLGAFAQGD